MSLLETLPYEEYVNALKFSSETCQELAKIAKIETSYKEIQRPGEKLLQDLHRLGYNVTRYHKLLRGYYGEAVTNVVPSSREYEFKPSSKVAVLIANEIYKEQSKLKTPEKDCHEIGRKLKNLGFILIILKNLTAQEIKSSIGRVLAAVPEKSYFVTYLAGHGAEINGIRYIFGVDTHREGIRPSQIVSANCLLSMICTRNPMLCLLMMDTCSYCVEPDQNPELFKYRAIEKYSFDGNLIVGYSSSSEQPAYEKVEISCNTESIDSSGCLDTAQLAAAVPAGSQYATAFCRHADERTRVSAVLDRVAIDLQNARKKQLPIKVESGPRRLYFIDPVSGDHNIVKKDLMDAFNTKESTNYFML